jgi:adenine-specific DNA glycosylase
MAAQKGRQNEFPETPKPAQAVEVLMAALLVVNKDKVLVRKRSEKEKWLKGLWEFPSVEGNTFEEALKKLERRLKVKAWRKELKEIKHQITNHKIRLKLYPATAPKAVKLPAGHKWIARKNLATLPFSSAQDKLRKFVQS